MGKVMGTTPLYGSARPTASEDAGSAAESAAAATSAAPAFRNARLLSLSASILRLLAGHSGGRQYTAVPYFWSDQYGVRIQFAGHRRDGDAVRVIEGDPDDRSFLAAYERDGRTVAVLGMNQPKLFTRWRRQLHAPDPAGACTA